MATVRVKWADSLTPDVTNHKIYRDSVPATGEVLLATVGLGVGVAGYDDTTAVEGEEYKYEVQAVNPTGESTDENTDSGGNVKTIVVGASFLFEDTFDGTTIDVAKWTKVENNPTDVSITQNNTLIASHLTTAVVSAFDSGVKGIDSYDMTTIDSIAFDIIKSDSDNDYAIGMSKDAILSDFQNSISWQNNSTTGLVSCNVKTAGAANVSTTTLDFSGDGETIKIQFIGGNAVYSVWNGALWATRATIAMTMTGNFYPFFMFGNDADASGTTTIDNVVITDTPYSTLRP